ncbi:MAG: hypothetical protein MRJ93_02965 [Nitrososphaeraceae archaeon]|nr:hypothetical protein [Nitrososphaeraceae archaeon]
MLRAILIAGTISTMIPRATFAQSYEYSYGKDQKSSKINFQKVNCNNIIINGLDSAGQGTGADMLGTMMGEGYDDGTDQWLGKGDIKESIGINDNIVNFCKNNNGAGIVEPLPPSQITTLYVANNSYDTVEIYDVSDPSTPIRVGEFNGGNLNGPMGITTQGTTLYVTNVNDDTFKIYDVNDPRSPVHINEFNAGNLNQPSGIAAEGTTLYVTNRGDNTVEIYDISDPSAPVRESEFGAIDLDAQFGIASQDTTLYVTNVGDGTVEIYDITNPSSPVHVSEFGSGDLSEPNVIAIQSTTL